MYLAAYHVDMPWQKSRSKDQGDYFIQFLTHQITHPEFVDEAQVLDDACSRIPHLKSFISVLRTPNDAEPGVMPRISFACCSYISLEQAANERLTPDNYSLGVIYGDEQESGEIDTYFLPPNNL